MIIFSLWITAQDHGMLVIETLKCKISHFLNSNMCFCSRLYGTWSGGNHQWDFKLYIWVKQTNKQTKLRTNIKNIVVVCSCVFLFFFFCTKYSWSKVRIFVKYVGLFWFWFLVFWSNSEEIIFDDDLDSIFHFPIN